MILETLVLASASPRRLELLRSLGLDVRVEPSGYDEPDDPTAPPQTLAIRHAAAKAREVQARFPDDLVVAADTVVDVDGVALGKPRDPDDAARMLRMLSGRTHAVHTAYAIAFPGRRDLIEESSTTKVRFYRLGDDEIADYVATGEPMDKAGAYAIQGLASRYVERIEGEYSNVVGLPVSLVYRMLASGHGIR